ncbi:MAG TPA: PAS domain S-box protein, partial [Bacteroidetes bacterium]|nr:PAS domain S-box protein [Bacteroidota bacterium]
MPVEPTQRVRPIFRWYWAVAFAVVWSLLLGQVFIRSEVRLRNLIHEELVSETQHDIEQEFALLLQLRGSELAGASIPPEEGIPSGETPLGELPSRVTPGGVSRIHQAETRTLRSHLVPLHHTRLDLPVTDLDARALKEFQSGAAAYDTILENGRKQFYYALPVYLHEGRLGFTEEFRRGELFGVVSAKQTFAPLEDAASAFLLSHRITFLAFWTFGTLSIAIISFLLYRQDRRRARELQESRFLMRAADQSPTVLLLTDTEARIQFVNPRFTEVTGYMPDEVIGKNPRLLSSGQTPRATYEELWETITRGEVWRGEFINRRKNGEVFYESAAIAPITDDTGRIVQYLALKEDVTERKYQEELLGKQREMFSRTFHSSHVAMVINRLRDGVFLEVNDSFLKHTGYAREEIIGKSYEDVDFGIDRDLIVKLIQDLNEQGQMKEREIEYRPRGGSVSYAHISAAVIEYEGEPCSLFHAIDITERRRAEEALRESEARFRAISESARDAVIMVDSEGTIRFWNEAAVRVFGYEQEEALEKPVHELIAPEEYQERITPGLEVFKREGTGAAMDNTLELRAMRKGGETFPVELSLASFRIGGEWNAVGIVRDITERISARRALAESEERYRSFAESSIDGIIVVDDQYRFTYVNQAMADLVGYSREELIGKDFRNYLPDSSRELVADRYRRRQKGEQVPQRYEFEVLHRSGELKRVEISSSVIPGPGGKPETLSHLYDVTELKRAERELVRSERRLRTVVEKSRDGIYVRRGVRLLLVNPAFIKICGYTEEELLSGRVTTLSLIAPEDRAREEEFERRVDRGEVEYALDTFTIVTKDGRRIIVENSLTRILWEGEPAVLGFLRDVTERGLLEEQLQQAQKMESIGRLAGGVAHDFNNLLTSISGHAELAKLKLSGDDPVHADLDEVLRSS